LFSLTLVGVVGPAFPFEKSEEVGAGVVGLFGLEMTGGRVELPGI
jgi:hypothetical protein